MLNSTTATTLIRYAAPFLVCSSALAQQAGLSTQDWSGIRTSIEASQHRVFEIAGGHEAHNPGQSWSVEFDGRGVFVSPQGAGWNWGLQLESFGFEACSQEVAVATSSFAEGGRLTYRWSDNLEEWYINDSRGLEHGYTLQSRPTQLAAATGPLTFAISVRGSLGYQIQSDGQGLHFSTESGEMVLAYSGLHVYDVNGVTQSALFVADGKGFRIEVDESSAQYPLTIDPIAYQAYLKASNTDAGDLFGEAVAISGDTVVIGAPHEASAASGVNGNQGDNSMANSGAAYVFVRNGSTWSQQAYLKASHPDVGDEFGKTVGISRDRIVIGAPNEDSSIGINGNGASNSAPNSGAAFVFERVGGVWSQQALLKGAVPGLQDHFGSKVAVSGDRVLVSARGEDSNATGVDGDYGNNSALDSGAVFVFEPSGGTWVRTAYIKASNTDAGDEFGSGLAVDGDRFVVGARFEESVSEVVNGDQNDNTEFWRGAAYLFEFNGSFWSQEAYLKGRLRRIHAVRRFGRDFWNYGCRGSAARIGWRDRSQRNSTRATLRTRGCGIHLFLRRNVMVSGCIPQGLEYPRARLLWLECGRLWQSGFGGLLARVKPERGCQRLSIEPIIDRFGSGVPV